MPKLTAADTGVAVDAFMAELDHSCKAQVEFASATDFTAKLPALQAVLGQRLTHV